MEEREGEGNVKVTNSSPLLRRSNRGVGMKGDGQQMRATISEFNSFDEELLDGC